MAEHPDLRDFLQESAALGSPVEEGGFTISPEQAWKRLRHSLPHQSYWILKLLQCAVRWNAERFAVTAEASSVTIEFSGRPEDETVTAATLLGAEFEGAGIGHLRVALAGACADPQFETVAWTWYDGERSFTVEWAGERVEVKQLDHDRSDPPLARVRVTHGEVGWFRTTFGTTPFSEELAALRARAWPSPTPLILNGETLALPAPEEKDAVVLGSAHLERPLLRVDVRFWRHLQLPYYYDFMATKRVRKRRPPYGSHPRESTSDLVRWARDGVVVDEWEVAPDGCAASTTTLLSAEGLTLDLSGFAVRRDTEAEQRLRDSTPHRRQLVEELLASDLTVPLGHNDARARVRRSVAGRHLFIGLICWPYLLPAAVEIFRLPKITDRVLRDDLESCRNHLRRRAGVLGKETV